MERKSQSFLLLAPSASAATMEAPFYYCETTLENASACDAQIQGQSSSWKGSENLHCAPKFDAGSNDIWYAFGYVERGQPGPGSTGKGHFSRRVFSKRVDE